MTVEEILGYKAFVIEERERYRFHAFCQTYLKGKKAHIDTRGVTTSFDGFTEVVGEFVKEPFNIRRINEKDIAEWQSSSDNSHEEHLALAEAVIKANIECNKIN